MTRKKATNDKKAPRTTRKKPPDTAWHSQLSGLEVGEYVLGTYVGKGKVGFVYQGTDKKLPDTTVAIKLVFRQPKSGWENEIKKVAKLGRVDNVVHYHAQGTAHLSKGDRCELCIFTVWDFIPPGRNLADYLDSVGTISVSFLLAVCDRILRVLNACESEGVVRHGDLHAGNILVGEESASQLDDQLQPRLPIYVSDFGYGATGLKTTPKDDYEGLAAIVNLLIQHVDYAAETATHKRYLQAIKPLFGKLLSEAAASERTKPLALLHQLKAIQTEPTASSAGALLIGPVPLRDSSPPVGGGAPGLGQFQVSEMIGDQWEWWERLFVPTVPARSRILGLDIPTVVTGPRGCGKTMLFRRLSERLVVECGPVPDLPAPSFAALYVNANDIADAFAHYPKVPTEEDERRLICYTHLCLLADLLAVESARQTKGNMPTSEILEFVGELLTSAREPLLVGEDRLEHYRACLEQIKSRFSRNREGDRFPGYDLMSELRWLQHFAKQLRRKCPWIAGRPLILFIDDYSTPRVSRSMQVVLNRLLLQRSPEFLTKIATEAWTTFIPQDASGKNLQDGDDYQMVDIGEESLFLRDDERLAFLNQVFLRRFKIDGRIAASVTSLADLLGHMDLSKTEFARRLRISARDRPSEDKSPVAGDSQRRGRTKPRALYYGDNVFAELWSGDTRTMIQLLSGVVEQAGAGLTSGKGQPLTIPIDPNLQDRTFRNRGGEWLTSHTRNEPTNPELFKKEIDLIQQSRPGYRLSGQFGDHLKAIVEAFQAAANALLQGPTYDIKEGDRTRSVPRMAFRIEIVDEFRVSGVAEQIYRDLIRYGLFMRDNRGKSVRGSFVPRLYLRRLLLPYCTLALSKRDSVPMTCAQFVQLLLEPDAFRRMYTAPRYAEAGSRAQLQMFEEPREDGDGPDYDDLGREPEGEDDWD